MSLIHSIITKLVGKGTNQKINTLGSFQDNETLRALFRLMLCPSVIYNIKKLPRMPELTEPPEREDSWLLDELNALIKADYRGAALKAAISVIYIMSSYKHRDVILWILSRKNPAKMGKTIVNKIWPDLIRTQPYMGAIPGTTKALVRLFLECPHVHAQVKEDGMCILIDYKDGEPVAGRTRQGNDIGKYFPEFMGKLNAVHIYDPDSDIAKGFNGMVHHELFCGVTDRPASNGKISKQVKNSTIGGHIDTMLHSVVLDYVDHDRPNVNQRTRYNNLNYFVSDVTFRVYQRVVNTLWEATEFVKEVIKSGGEGLILKNPESSFKNGKPWFNVKMKNEFSIELRCIDTKPHSAIPELIGAVLCESEDHLLQVWVTPRRAGYRAISESFWLGKIFTVKCESVTAAKKGKPARLQLPRFDGSEYISYVRDDKDTADTYQEIINQEAMSHGLI